MSIKYNGGYIPAVGADGTTLVANSSASTGVSWAGPSVAAGKNAIINGGYDIAQRGTTFTNTGNGVYTFDRWTSASSSSTSVQTRQTTGVPAGVQYCMRVTYNAASSYYNVNQYIETANVSQMWGKTVTFSVKLRKNATFATNMQITIYKTSTVDGGNSATWTALASTSITNASLSTGTTSADWYTASVTTNIPADGTANGLKVGIEEISAGVSGAYYEIAQPQLELGSTATTFSRAGGSIGGELAACQRYYYRNNSGGSSTFFAGGIGAYATTNAICSVVLPVPMRVTPTVIDTSGTASNYRLYNGVRNLALSVVPTINSDSSPTTVQLIATVTTGLTVGDVASLTGNSSTSAYIGLGAEL